MEKLYWFWSFCVLSPLTGSQPVVSLSGWESQLTVMLSCSAAEQKFAYHGNIPAKGGPGNVLLQLPAHTVPGVKSLPDVQVRPDLLSHPPLVLAALTGMICFFNQGYNHSHFF